MHEHVCVCWQNQIKQTGNYRGMAILPGKHCVSGVITDNDTAVVGGPQ